MNYYRSQGWCFKTVSPLFQGTERPLILFTHYIQVSHLTEQTKGCHKISVLKKWSGLWRPGASPRFCCEFASGPWKLIHLLYLSPFVCTNSPYLIPSVKGCQVPLMCFLEGSSFMCHWGPRESDFLGVHLTGFNLDFVFLTALFCHSQLQTHRWSLTCMCFSNHDLFCLFVCFNLQTSNLVILYQIIFGYSCKFLFVSLYGIFSFPSTHFSYQYLIVVIQIWFCSC